MKLQRMSKSLELPCGWELGHWLIFNHIILKGSCKDFITLPVCEAKFPPCCTSAKPGPGDGSSSGHHLCWGLLGFITFDGNYWDSSEVLNRPELMQLLPHTNPFYFPFCSCPYLFHQQGQTPAVTPAQIPAVKELLGMPWLGLSSADSRVLHQQSCVSTRVFTIIAVLAE